MKLSVSVGIFSLVIGLLVTPLAFGEDLSKPLPSENNALNLSSGQPNIWTSHVGEGFLRSTQQFSLVAGAGIGLRILGTEQEHDIAMTGLSYGRMWGNTKGAGQWWSGNWEWRVELFGGSQFAPVQESLVGIAPHLRYNFNTSSRLMPFLDIGVGITDTSIGPPDLGGHFEFNEQIGAGFNYFISNDLAMSLESRFIHISSFEIYSPNLGVNNCMFLAGMNWFF